MFADDAIGLACVCLYVSSVHVCLLLGDYLQLTMTCSKGSNCDGNAVCDLRMVAITSDGSNVLHS